MKHREPLQTKPRTEDGQSFRASHFLLQVSKLVDAPVMRWRSATLGRRKGGAGEARREAYTARVESQVSPGSRRSRENEATHDS